MEEKILINGKISIATTVASIVGWNAILWLGIFLSCMDTMLEDFAMVMSVIIPIWVVILLLLVVCGYYANKDNGTLVVTDKRIYGQTLLGKRVDLPNDNISSVGVGVFNTIMVATDSGKIKFSFMGNSKHIHNTIISVILAEKNKNT